MSLYLSFRPIVSCWSGKGPQNRIKLIGMTGSYSPEAFMVLDSPVSKSSFPFSSPTNPFCVGDRVQIEPGTQMSEEFEKVLCVYSLIFSSLRNLTIIIIGKESYWNCRICGRCRYSRRLC